MNKEERALLRTNKDGSLDNAHLYGFLLIMKRLLLSTEFESLKKEIIQLTQKYPFVRMDYYGFRADWQEKL